MKCVISNSRWLRPSGAAASSALQTCFVAFTAPAFAQTVSAPGPELGTGPLGFMLATGVVYLLKRRAGK
jgi:hypothetical protein